MSNSPSALGLVIGSWSCCTASISGSPTGLSFAFHLGYQCRLLRRRPSNLGKPTRATAHSGQHCLRVKDPVCFQQARLEISLWSWMLWTQLFGTYFVQCCSSDV